jgi:hypothetical protein
LIVRDGQLYGVHTTQILDTTDDNVLKREEPGYSVLPKMGGYKRPLTMQAYVNIHHGQYDTTIYPSAFQHLRLRSIHFR